MAASRSPSRALTALLLVAAGVALHLPLLGEPLLEGAAGKQTHTAMVARNLYRGRATLARPTVDDLGTPGYFVKEVPVLPALTAALYGAAGGVHESFGRALSLAAWLCGVPLVLALRRRAGRDAEALVAAAWWIGAPLAYVYARAFMSDAAMVTVSLATLLAALRWREAPGTGRACAAGALLGAALLLKPHAVFWLASSLAVVARARADATPRPQPRALAAFTLAAGAGAALAAAWYAHAALVHVQFPAAGATSLRGWFDAATLLDPALYLEIARQQVRMVFTPVGTLLAVAAVVLVRRGWDLGERALLAWACGVVLQCLVFDTRMFDDLARGTEYYQLAMVPVAGLLIARGLVAVDAAVAGRRAGLRAAFTAALVALLAGNAVFEARAALAVPERYRRILDDCAFVRETTAPRDDLFVLADRGGTILYYCDRRGVTFVPARAVQRVFARADNVVGTRQLADALDAASWVYVPFPELLGERSSWLAHFEESWQRVPAPGREVRLYRRSGPAGRR